MTSSFNEFTSIKFQNELRRLDPEHRTTHCAFQIVLAYKQRQITVKSTIDPLKLQRLVRARLIFDTIINPGSSMPLVNLISTTNEFKIKCDTNWCDRQFMLKHIGWLSKENYSNLENTSSSFFVSEAVDSGYCLHNGKMKECPNRICYVYHSDKEFKTQSGCYLLPRKNAMLELKFEINFGENPGTVNGKEIGVPAKYEIVNSLFDINYFCTWNMYNDPSIMTNISEVVNLHCNVSAIKEALQAVIYQCQW
ncbi:unnamed protein product [Rotaria socialis]